MSKSIITIVGPTGIGKTDLSIFLAKSLKSEIKAIYIQDNFIKKFQLGLLLLVKMNSKPNSTLILFNNKSIKEYYSVGEFEMEALSKIRTLHKKYNTIIVVMDGDNNINSLQLMA